MNRRTFIKNTLIAGAAAAVAPSALLSVAGCDDTGSRQAAGFDFDDIIDRSGTYSIKLRGADGRLPMWIADMDFRTAPHVHDALIRRIDRDVMGYTYTPDEYCSVIQKWVREQQSWDLRREWISYCPGVITGIALAIECFSQPGDKVIVQPPVYDPFARYARQLGREAVDNPLILEGGQYRMDFNQLEQLVSDSRTKLMVLCNPHNPGGMMWDRESLKKVAEICARHGVRVLADEIHCDLALGGRRHIPFLSVSEEAADIGIIFTGPTKTFNLAGLHAAQCYIADQQMRKQYIDFLDARKLTEASIPAIEVTLAAYGHDDEWLQALKRYLQSNVELVRNFIAREIPGIKVISPQASFLVWLDCRALGLPQGELVELFQDKAGIRINNGASYGQGGEGFIRMNIGCPRSIVEQALRLLKAAL